MGAMARRVEREGMQGWRAGALGWSAGEMGWKACARG